MPIIFMNKERELVRIFVEINEGEGKINYYRGSWEGPKVTPRRFYPSRLIKLVKGKSKDPLNREYVPDPSKLKLKAPKDNRINAYILGDTNYFSIWRVLSISQAVPGRDYSRGQTESSEHFGSDDLDQRIVCVSYCMLSQKDLKKKEPVIL